MLRPQAVPSLWHDGPPRLIDYVQLPVHLWVPDFFLPHLVPFMPCPEEGCNASTSRRRWRSHGPRLIHGVHHAEYLHCWEYECSRHKGHIFLGWDQRCLSKMKPLARSHFRFVLTPEEGVTLELHARIVDARMGGSTLNALHKELTRNRYTRLYETVAAYYQHCELHKMAASGLMSFSRGRAVVLCADAPNPPQPQRLLRLRGAHRRLPERRPFALCEEQTDMWAAYTQQLTASRVCIDSTWKIAKRLKKSNLRLLWSMMDIETGCILTQQMLTHERHDDLKPMLFQFVARCKELNMPLPARVCSDRGLMDSQILNHPNAFPDAHINVDPWHFQQLFTATLNKGSTVWKDVSKEFSKAMYKAVASSDGSTVLVHAEPNDIITAVDALIKRYSYAGSDALPCITKATKDWWAGTAWSHPQRPHLQQPARG